MANSIVAEAAASPLISEQKVPYTHFNRKLIYGVAVCDFHSPISHYGKIIPSYRYWHHMIKRCYSTFFHGSRPTYIDCSVVKEWLSFTFFEKWFRENYIKGYDLDKDILVPGNRVYGPDTCVFIPQELNKLLIRTTLRGKLPWGVYMNRKRFGAQVTRENQNVKLGTYDTPLEAHKAWQLAKALIIEQFPTTNPRIRKALDLRVAQLRDDHANNRITTKL